jgi:hypothetical protein
MISLYDEKTSKAAAPTQPKIRLYSGPSASSATAASKASAPPIRLYSTPKAKTAAPAKSPSSYNLGDDYGKSTVNDKYSGKPLMTFEDKTHMSSDLLTNRVAPDFDPTKPQKIDPSVLHNDRMPAAASDAVRKATGAAPNTQLDHLISLELGGSNDSSNLNPEDLKPNGSQYSLADEDKIAKLVANGDKTGVSYIDGQKMIARLKGVQLPDDPDFPSAAHPLSQYYPKAAAHQTISKPNVPGIIATTAFPGLMKSLADIQTNPLSLGSSLKDIVSTPFSDTNQATDALKATIQHFALGIKNNAPVSQKIGDALSIVSAGIGRGLAPLAGLFDAAGKVPVVGTIAKLVFNVPFALVGDVGSDLGMGALNALPISKDAKDQLEPGVRAVYSLAGQIAGGEYVAPDVLDTLTKQFGSADAKAIIAKAQELAKQRKGFVDFGADVGNGESEESSKKDDEVAPVKNFTGGTNAGLTPEQSQSIKASGEKGTAEASALSATEQEAIKAHNEMAEKSVAAPPVPQDSFFQKLKNTINPLKQQDPQTQKIFQDYTKKLAASRQLGNDEAKTLSDIPVQEGWDAILREERGSASPYTDKIKGKFQDLLAEGRSRGLDTSERKNYVPHAYAETPEEIKQVTRNYLVKKGVPAAEVEDFMNETHPIPDSTAKRLGLNPFFTKTRIFPTYDDAIAAGLHPKYTHPAQLAGFYRETMERNIANRELVKDLVTNGKLFTGDLAPKGYQPVNLEFSSKGYYAKPRLAQMLNGLFHDANSTTFMDRVAGITGKISSTVQKMELTTGVPKMNVNLHSLGQLIKEITAGDVGKVGTFIRSQSDRASVKFFEDNAGVLKRMASNNIDVGKTVGDYENLYPNLLKPGVKDAYARGGAKSVAAFLTKESGVGFEKVFSKKNFSSFMPQLLVQTFKDASDHFVAQGMDRPAADALAADVTRAYHGLIGNVGRSQGTKDGLSAAFYAPPFRESIINTLWNSVKSVTTEIGNPAYYKNRNLLAGMGLTYGLYAAANKYFTGHYIWQNPSTHQFDLQIPTGNGNYAYIPFMPSFLAVPRDVLGGTLSTAEGDLKGATQEFTGVLSAPAQLFGQLYANKDFYGRPIYADTDSGAVKAQKIASYLGLNTMPPFVKEAVNYIQNKGTTPLYQSITAGLALPIKYGSAAKNNTSDFYNALDNYNAQHAQAMNAFKPTFDKIQQLLQSGQKDEALKEVNALSDSDYELYKDLKAGTSRSSTTKAEAQFLPIFRSIQKLLQDGKTDQANGIVNGLSDSDWKLYQSLKKKNIQ